MFKFRKRVPNNLIEIVGKKEFLKVCATEAEFKTVELSINQAVVTMESSLPSEAKKGIVVELLKDFIQKKPTTVPNKNITTYNEAVDSYLKSSTNVTQLEYNNRVYFFKDLLPALLQHTIKSSNPELSKLTATVLHQVSQLIPMLPMRNIQKYRSMDSVVLVSDVAKGQITLAPDELLSTTTVNKLIKRIRALAFYGGSTGLYSISTAVATVKSNTKGQRDERDYLTQDEINTLIVKADDRVKVLLQVSRYSGMRLSELTKCKITTIDNIMCFDLKNINCLLKTQSSYRLIPVHSNLLPIVDEYISIANQGSTSLRNLAKKVKKLIDYVLVDTDKKSLYSLRHSFATELIHQGVDSGVVSELLGHSHASMTLQRYAKGFSINRLREAIELL